jgi:hypothetical protein
VEPDDAPAAAQALQRLAQDAALRAQNVQRGTEFVRDHTIEAETARLAGFLAGRVAA